MDEGFGQDPWSLSSPPSPPRPCPPRLCVDVSQSNTLLPDFALKDALLAIMDVTKADLDQTTSRMNCQLCDEEHVATHLCQDCSEYMCDSLAEAHTKLRANRGHVLVELDGNQSLATTQESPWCSEHPNQKYVAYDINCSRLVCGLCSSVGQHVGHRCNRLDEAKQKLCSELREGIVEGNNTIAILKQSVQRIDELTRETEALSTTAEAEIRRCFEQLRSELNDREAKLLAEVKQTKKSRLFDLHDQLQCLKHALACTQYNVDVAQGVASNQTSTVMIVLTARQRVSKLEQVQRAVGTFKSALRGADEGGWSTKFEVAIDTVSSCRSLIRSVGEVSIVEFEWTASQPAMYEMGYPVPSQPLPFDDDFFAPQVELVPSKFQLQERISFNDFD
eukprot:c20747_g1_i3.p1 GENE.c20747_g1_i3~~c20747_g1_i3.p1  ORF type:complete len:408 (+),score=80.75 c20747_g1_i3:52-1224(+)